MKTPIIIIAFLMTSSTTAFPADLVVSQKLITNAVEYGLKSTASSEGDFLSEWMAKPKNISMVSIDNMSFATIFTPFMQFAYFSYAEKTSPTNQEKKLLSESIEKTLNFRILCYGKSNDFPDKSKVELRIKRKTILRPVKYGATKIERIEGGHFDDDAQAYGGAIFCSFDKTAINNEDSLELTLFEGTRNLSLIYEFDLRKIK